MSGLSAGELDREVTIQQLSESIGGSSYPVETWTTLDTPVFMSRRDQRGYEAFKTGSAMVSGAVQTVWTLQYREDMDPELIDVTKARRLVYASRSYDIVGASTIGRGEGIELMTVAAGAVRQ